MICPHCTQPIFYDPLEAWRGVCPSCLEDVRLVFLYEVNTGTNRVVAVKPYTKMESESNDQR